MSLLGLKVNPTKSVFCIDKIEYLDFYITRDSIKPMHKKVHTILELDRSKKYYRHYMHT